MGAWSHISDQSARDAYEEAVESGVIKDSVLENAVGGSALTYALFHNLRNPLFHKYKFDAKEFVGAVGPALENFHEVLACLRTELSDLPGPEEEAKAEKKEEEEEETQEINGLDVLLGSNYWRKQANSHSDSLAGRLSKMTSDACFDAFYYTSKFDQFARISFGSNADGGFESVPDAYIRGSCRVSDVAILGVKAMELGSKIDGKEIKDGEFPEFRASDEENQQDESVAARVSVIYEVTHEYKLISSETPSQSTPFDSSEAPTESQAKSVGSSGQTTEKDTVVEAKAESSEADSADKIETKIQAEYKTGFMSEETVKEQTTEKDTVVESKAESSVTDSADKIETNTEAENKTGVKSEETVEDPKVSYTSLAVAVFEGWLYEKEKKKSDLRWKVSLLREAMEFPNHQPTIIRTPPK